MAADDFDFEHALDRLLDASPNARADILSAIGSEHPDAVERLERLLDYALGATQAPQRADDTAPRLFEEMLTQQDLERVGTQVGPYEISALINRGGMGVVFRAERNDGVYAQTVAVKFLPQLAKSAQRRDLFLAERSNLARLEHPNIARIIDAGLTGDESPYFVMEFIAGEPVDKCCQSKSREQRLGLFDQICDAISYCHQSFVVHGDIKPSNILVENSRVRILDFGVGQWIEEGKSNHTLSSGFSRAYAAPELLRGGPHTVASDIYALGVLLAELLQAPESPLPSDLRAIVDKCRSADPNERFASVESLQRELKAYRDGYPITARGDESFYVLSKFVRRNKTTVAGVVAVVLSLVAGLSATLWQYNNATEEALRAEQTATFVKSLFDRVNPEDAGSEAVTLQQIMDEAAIRIRNELTASPDVRADVMALLASGYSGLGQHQDSLALRTEVLEYHQRTKPTPSEELAAALTDIGVSYRAVGDYQAARSAMRDAVRQFEALGDDSSVALANTLGLYALMMTNRTGGKDDVETAIALLERKGRILEASAPDDVYLRYIHLSELASGYDELGEHDKAADFKERAVQLAEENGYAMQMSAITVLCNLGYSYDGLGQYGNAVITYKKCIERRRERLGDDHPEIVPAQQNLAAALIEQGKFAEARESLLATVAAAKAQLPEQSFVRLAVEVNLARVNLLLGNTDEALEALPDILGRMENVVGESAAPSARIKSIFGLAKLQKGEIAESLELLRTSHVTLEASSYAQQDVCRWCTDATLWLAQAEYRGGDKSLAKQLAATGVKMRQQENNVQAWRLAEARAVLAEVSQ